MPRQIRPVANAHDTKLTPIRASSAHFLESQRAWNSSKITITDHAAESRFARRASPAIVDANSEQILSRRVRTVRSRAAPRHHSKLASWNASAPIAARGVSRFSALSEFLTVVVNAMSRLVAKTEKAASAPRRDSVSRGSNDRGLPRAQRRRHVPLAIDGACRRRRSDA